MNLSQEWAKNRTYAVVLQVRVEALVKTILILSSSFVNISE